MTSILFKFVLLLIVIGLPSLMCYLYRVSQVAPVEIIDPMKRTCINCLKIRGCDKYKRVAGYTEFYCCTSWYNPELVKGVIKTI